jgi:hypothetical protein
MLCDMYPSWDDPILAVASDTPRMARYRLLQSRWRETVLALPPGLHRSGRLVGSLLADDAPADAQWLTGEIAEYVRARVPVARRAGEAIEVTRLRRNLLSSQPLCFNVFGQLAAYPMAGARVMSRLLDLDVDTMDEVLVEHAPPEARRRLADRSAFDAHLRLTVGRQPVFVGVETKYTEPFSRTEYTKTSYDQATKDSAGWFVRDVGEQAQQLVTNQLWRTLMLAQLSEQTSGGATGHVLVLSADEDAHATAAVAGMRPLLRHPDRLHHVTLTRLAAEAMLEDELRPWAALLTRRYLDI